MILRNLKKCGDVLFRVAIIQLLAVSFLYSQENDSIPYPINDGDTGGLYLDDQLEYAVTYIPEKEEYLIQAMIGDVEVGAPVYMTQSEYLDLILERNIKTTYRQKSRELDQAYRDGKNGEDSELGIPSIQVNSQVFESIFGGDKIELIPQGNAAFDVGVLFQKIDNPQLLPQNRNTFTFDLQQRIQMSLLGKVGENLNLQLNYDTQAGFAFENRLNLAWRPNAEGGEDNIIQNIEFGNVSMPLNTSLIQGAQSLFGVKTDLKFGRTNVSAIFSQQQSETRNIAVQGDGLVNTFKVFAENYEYNKHFFLGHFFRSQYNTALNNYPLINSNINISRIEVWRIDRAAGSQQERRSILAVRDLGENAGNDAIATENGTLYNNIAGLAGIRDVSTARNTMQSFVDPNTGEVFQDGENYVINENARKLDPSEYTFYPQLGYISLNNPLTDGEDLLAVSIQYTEAGEVRRVGEVSNEEDELLIVKLLKPNNAVNVASPMWDLMMKNIYSLNAISLIEEDFLLNVFFKELSETASGNVNYLPGTNIQDQSLIQVMGVDRLDRNGNIQQNGNITGDGLFDYLPGITINQQQGTVTFTKVEPFGDHLRSVLDAQFEDEFVFDEMYDQIPGLVLGNNLSQRYSLEGRFKGETGGGIPLGAFNVPQGSVIVTANGRELQEGIDYTVNYELGRVNIINQQLIDSGAAINVQLENQSTFNLQRKRLLGLNVEHRYSDNFIVGGTLLNYQERPLTQKALYGSEPVNNTLVGVNAQYNGSSEAITRIVNKIPGIKTDKESQINFSAEAAYLIPGTNDAVNGQSYIDDFEDSQTDISLLDAFSWRIASTPGSPAGTTDAHPLFPNGILTDDLNYNNGRRLISWYSIDPRFYGIGGATNVSDAALSNHRSRRVQINELFDQRDVLAGTINFLSTLDITFYPEFRGPYNINFNNNDTENWGGLMRQISVSNFVDSNIEYIEFWLMDPYADGTGSEGDLILQVGNVSEDILKDGELQYENGLPTPSSPSETSTSNWGQQPENYPVVYAFDSTGDERRIQDVGFDGLSNEEEGTVFGVSGTNPITGELDPAGDDYLFYLDSRWDDLSVGNSVVNRYRYFNNSENNSPDGSLEASSAAPDAEDVNNDYNLDQAEFYTQYRIPISQTDLADVNNRFIVSRKNVDITFENGQPGNTTWYQFRIPVDEFDLDLDGDGNDDITNTDQLRAVLTSARFMRLIMQGFTEETTLRFGTLDLVRSDWRRFSNNIFPDGMGDEGTEEVDISNIEVGEVDIESNSTSQPPYVLPPGIQREQLQGTTGFQSQNESSMVIQAELDAQEARGVFRNVNLDLRRYKKMEMFIHAEDLLNLNNASFDSNAKLFIRMGSDYSNNYYEYETSLQYTPVTATSVSEIWPDENILDIVTDAFVQAKLRRDSEGFLTTERYVAAVEDGNTDKLIYVKGRPSLGNVTSLMIGLRNNDGVEKRIRVWVNELRLSEIDNEGGYAATANFGVNLGDFAQINATGTYNSVGFGAIDVGPSQRSQEELKEYAITSNINLDKFLPENWGLQLPLTVNYGEQFIDPKFNPLDNDVELDEAPNRDDLTDIVRTYTRRQGFGMSNIRKIKKSGGKNHFYDVSNFSFSFLYNNDYFRDIYTEYNVQKTFRGSVNYSYTFKNKFYKPFKDWRMVSDTAKSEKYLRWIKEFNFNPLPSRISFRTDVARTYNELKFRDINALLGGIDSEIAPTFSNQFLFSWQYNVGFDFTKSLKLDYTSTTVTLNDEERFNQLDRNIIWKDITSVGRPTDFGQTVSVNYRTPLNLFPYLFWTNLELGADTSYNWVANSTVLTNDSGENLGNSARNASSFNARGQLNFTALYQAIPAFTKLDSVRNGRRREIDSLNQAYTNTDGKNQRKRNSKPFKFKHKYKLKDYLLIAASSIKNAQFNYNQTNGAVLPGLLSEPGFWGFNRSGTGTNGLPFGSGAPGFGFIYGTTFDIKKKAIENGWVTDSELLLEPYQINKAINFDYNIQVEPANKLNISVTGLRNTTFRSLESNYNLDRPDIIGDELFVDEQQTITTSVLTLGTAFKDSDELYNQLLENSQIISERLGVANNNSTGLDPNTGYFDGYGIGNADVLVSAFLATMQGQDASNSKLGFKRNFSLPNWNITYTGLIDIPWFRKRFTNIELQHNYNSSYTAAGVQSNINFYNDPTGRDLNNNFYADNTYGSVNIAESFSPLIGVDMTFRNNLQLRAQYNRDRIYSLSLANYTLNEDVGSEYVAGLGYIFKDLKIKMRYRGQRKTLKGDLNLRADLIIRDREARLRRLIEDDSQIIGGQRLFSLKINAEYDLSRNFSLRFYYEQDVSEYKISTAFPISTTRAGISANFTFGN